MDNQRSDAEPLSTSTSESTASRSRTPIWRFRERRLRLPSRPVSGSSKLTGKTILIVEDNAMVRDLLVTGLTGDALRNTVLAAENSTHALRVLADYPGRVDMMVTDVVMPGMSGRMLADLRADR